MKREWWVYARGEYSHVSLSVRAWTRGGARRKVARARPDYYWIDVRRAPRRDK